MKNLSQLPSSVFISLATALVLLSSGYSSASETRVSAERSIHTGFNTLGVNGRILHVETENGDIQFKATDADGITVDAQIVVYGRQIETCEQLISGVQIKVEVVGDIIEIVARKPRKFGYGYSITYGICAPRRLGVHAETVNGELLVMGATGPITLESMNGAVRAIETRGLIDASTTNGSVYLVQIAAPSIKASTVNGRVDCSVRGDAPYKIDVSTVNGSVEISLPSRIDATIKAETVNGGIQVDLGSGRVASKSRGRVEMRIGGGKSDYEFSSVNGAISVLVAQAD